MEYFVVALLAVVAIGIWAFVRQAKSFNHGMREGLEARSEKESGAGALSGHSENRNASAVAQQSLHLSDSEWNYSSFEEWMVDFKRTCGEHNPSLEVSGTGDSLVDFMEDEPLRRAYRDKVSPQVLGAQFARQFRVSDFGG